MVVEMEKLPVKVLNTLEEEAAEVQHIFLVHQEFFQLYLIKLIIS